MRAYTNIGGHDLPTFLFTNTEIVEINLFTITLVNGTIMRRATRMNRSITVLGVTFLPGNPSFSCGQIVDTIGTQVSNLEFTIIAQPTDLIGGIPVLQAAAQGYFDGAQIKVQRLFMDSSYTQIGIITRWLGELGDIKSIGRTMVVFDAKAMTQRLNQKTPKNLIQPGCLHTLYDAGCKLSKAAFAVGGIVQAGSTINKLITNLVNPNDYFDLGTMTFLSGTNVNLSYSVKLYTGGVLLLNRPLLLVPSAGDTFNAFPGCDKLQSTCDIKFSNLPNFKGFPFVPPPETAL